MEDFLGPLDDVLQQCLAPVLLAEGNEVDQSLLEASELPSKLGGLQLRRFAPRARMQYQGSKSTTRPITDLILAQKVDIGSFPAEEIQKLKASWNTQREQDRVQRFRQFLASDADRRLLLGVQHGAARGAPAWLAAIPLQSHDLCLNRKEWADVIALRFGQPLRNLPKRCGCGSDFSEPHGLQCPLGGFVIARHDTLRDFFTVSALPTTSSPGGLPRSPGSTA